MRSVAALILFVGVGLAGGSAYYVFAQVRAAEARLQRPAGETIETVQVAVADENLRFGQVLEEDHVRMVKWPADALPENAFDKVEDLLAEDKRRTVLRRMEPGEPILKSKITGFGEKATVAALLDPGMLAHTLKVDAVNSVGGFLLPGTRIDVFLTVRDRAKGPTTRLLMQNLEIIAVDQDTDPDRIEARVAKTVTVQAPPHVVRELTLAGSLGELSIALRGAASEQMAELGPLDRNQLLGIKEEVVAEAPEPEPEVTVRVRRAGSNIEIKTVQ